MKWCCRECGSSDVWELVSANMNTQELRGDGDGSAYCDECDDTVGVEQREDDDE
jgi:hypothetical protein